jgi:hypothetical protein
LHGKITKFSTPSTNSPIFSLECGAALQRQAKDRVLAQFPFDIIRSMTDKSQNLGKNFFSVLPYKDYSKKLSQRGWDAELNLH